MTTASPVLSWLSPEQIQADMSALQSLFVDRPELQGQWLMLRTAQQVESFLSGLDLPEDHRKRIHAQFQMTQSGQGLFREFADLQLPGPEPAYGKHVAPTPNQVIWQDERAQLLYYPGTGDCPILWVPAVINKHYILDLCERRSVIQRQQALGMQVFCLVWRNPESDEPVQDYVSSVIAATQFLGQPVHLAGYCLGGLLAAKAVLQGLEVPSLSIIASPLDGRMGELATWFTPLQRQHMQRCASIRGRVPAGVLSAGFLSLKPQSWGGLFHQARFPELATWLLDGLDVSPAIWNWICEEVYGSGGAFADGSLAQIDVPVWNQSFDQDHLVPPQTFDCQGGVINARAPGGHNGGLLRLQQGGWLDGWSRWLDPLAAVAVNPIETDRSDVAVSASAI